MIVGVTGHRPKHLGPGGYSEETFGRLVALAGAALMKYGATGVLSGMALGWDQAAAWAAVENGIPFIAVIPFEGQESTWPKAAQSRYRWLLDVAHSYQIVGSRDNFNRSMQVRNMYIVDHCELLLALYDGSGGGTKNCLDYAKRVDRRVVNVWGSWVKYR